VLTGAGLCEEADAVVPDDRGESEVRHVQTELVVDQNVRRLHVPLDKRAVSVPVVK
jgi:hypothetical protein